jgi:hypothetical protein
MDKRKRVDFNAIREELRGRCFICEMLAGNPEYQHHVVYDDDRAVAFLNRYPSLYGTSWWRRRTIENKSLATSVSTNTYTCKPSSTESVRQSVRSCRRSACTSSVSAANKQTATSIGISLPHHPACPSSSSSSPRLTPTSFSISLRQSRPTSHQGYETPAQNERLRTFLNTGAPQLAGVPSREGV